MPSAKKAAEDRQSELKMAYEAEDAKNAALADVTMQAEEPTPPQPPPLPPMQPQPTPQPPPPIQPQSTQGPLPMPQETPADSRRRVRSENYFADKEAKKAVHVAERAAAFAAQVVAEDTARSQQQTEEKAVQDRAEHKRQKRDKGSASELAA